MNWDLGRSGDGKKLQKEIFNDKIEVIPMTPTEEEQDLDCLAPFDNLADKKGKGKLVDDETENDEDELSNHVSPRSSKRNAYAKGSTSEQTDLHELKGLVVAGFATLTAKVNSVIDKIDMHILKTGEGHSNEKRDQPSQVQTTPLHSQSNQAHASATEGEGNDGKTVEKDTVENEGGTFSDTVGSDDAHAVIPDLDLNAAATDQVDDIEKQVDAPDKTKAGRPPRKTKPGRHGKEPYTTEFVTKRKVETRATTSKKLHRQTKGRRLKETDDL